MKKPIFIFFLLSLIGCTKKNIVYYPNEKSFLSDNTERIFKDNYKSITEEVVRLTYINKKPYIEIENNKKIKNILLNVRGNGLIKKRNVLQITSDSIFSAGNSFGINKLKDLLKAHYLNYGKSGFHSDSPEKALVEISLKKHQTKKELENILEKLTSEFDKVNEETKEQLELYVFLDYFSLLPPPPPPAASDID